MAWLHFFATPAEELVWKINTDLYEWLSTAGSVYCRDPRQLRPPTVSLFFAVLLSLSQTKWVWFQVL